MRAGASEPGFTLRPTRGGARRWLVRHAQAAVATLGVIARAPLATAMTVAVIGVALALPGALSLGLTNLDGVVAGLETESRISLFLQPEVDDDAARALAGRLEDRPEIAAVTVTGRAGALSEYERMIGLDGLDAVFGADNPLPAVLDVTPRGGEGLAARAEALGRILGQLDEVEMVRVDREWIARLEAVVALARRGLWLLSGFLAVAVVLVVGNTLRLAIDARREEIEVVRAFGGTDAFIRRPFLYNGAAVGLGGGALAWVLVWLASLGLVEPVGRLARSYASEYTLSTAGPELALLLVAGGAAAGFAGALMAVGRHLRRLDPR